MNREIKFRAWHLAEEKWHCLNLADISIAGYHEEWGMYTQICQYTGLKDKNGKEIYEGDIITTPTRFVHDTLDAIGTVQYLGTGFKSVGVGDFAGAQYQIQYDSEVIGNIYETPELIPTSKPSEA